ncbi:hypothetical protein M2138_001236 [Dysgonomonadaceae bacterium PH5-43]|nr:hypothetical protein [Dysgonomonadaceae bacterium PH5-43]
MKTKFFLFTFVSALFCLISCDDNIDSIGSGIQPDGGKIEIYDLSLEVKGETVKLDSIYAKSVAGLLGNINHPVYGSVKGDFACQFYPSGGFELDSMIVDDIDSIQLKLFYYYYLGDSLAPMEITVYPVVKQLEENYYTNLNLGDYADMNSVLGKRVYTARDLNISDSLNSANIIDQKYKVLSVTLPKELGTKFYNEYKKGKEGAFASVEAFADFFPGVYVTNTFGSGSMLEIEKTSIYMYYERLAASEDTIIQTTTFASVDVTKEVVQLNNYKSSGDETLLAPSSDKMYLKTPAGVFSKVTIPLSQIVDSIGSRQFSNVKLSINAYPKETNDFAWEFPGTGNAVGLETARAKLLLIEPDSINRFFENQLSADTYTTYYATLNSATNSYIFSNISNLLQARIDDAKTAGRPCEDLELMLIPVTVPYYYSSTDYYYTNPLDYASYHYLYPSAVTLKKGANNLNVQIIAADLESKGD